MLQIPDKQELMMSYLLGELPEHEQSDVEIRVLSDEKYLDQILLLEDELNDSFVVGTLKYSSGDPDRRESIELLKTIGKYIDRGFEHERVLKQAYLSRELARSLFGNGGEGLRLLTEIRSSEPLQPRSFSSPASPHVVAALIDNKLIHNLRGRLACTELALSILQNLETIPGVKFDT